MITIRVEEIVDNCDRVAAEVRISEEEIDYSQGPTLGYVLRNLRAKVKKQIQSRFIYAFNELASEVHATAKEKGWWDENRNDGEMICLIHSELSEALEALRHDNPPDDKVPGFSGAEAEMADAIIRIMDMAKARNWRLPEAVIAKMEMNKGRPRKHGGKLF